MRVAWKKVGLLMLLSVMVAVFPAIVQAAAGPSIVVDGKKLDLTGGARVEIVDGNVIIPIRIVTENLGFKVNWEAQTRKIDITDGSRTVGLTIGSKTAIVNGVEMQLLAAPVLKDGVTSVPLRFVSEQMGMNVSWDDQTKTATVTSPEPPPASGGVVAVEDISLNGRQLKIAVGGKVEPNVFAMKSPDRIVIDLPGTSLSRALEDRAGQKGVVSAASSAEIAGVRYALFSSNPSTVRVVIDLNIAATFNVLRGDAGEVIVELSGDGQTPGPGTETPGVGLPGADPQTPPVVTPEPPPVVTPEPPPVTSGKKLIVIDAGHGGSDPGAIGAGGKREKDFTLAIALKVEALLLHDPHLEAVLTRYDDTFIELGNRGTMANEVNADAFVSIHANSVNNSPSASGTESYHHSDSDKAFTQIMHKHLLNATGFKDRGVKQANFKVLRDASMVSVLLEAGFLSNAAEEAKLFDEGTQQRIAQAIVDGLKEYFGFI
ncbi:N-acetylmuramoyl-L-alanine amidase [Paenibacillus sp. 1P07SE]|uniref:N-acetylmuramoyl-L-alanine amidase n=1 Tax=Paenibacillus sp. 1P07SE TaxID=3132209 RepID=UPI0039A42913